MRTTRWQLPIGIVLAFVVGCSEQNAEPGSGQISDGSTTEATAWPNPIRLGLVPAEGGSDTVARFSPLTEHIEAELGIEVKAFSASEYVGIITAMQNDQVDIAYFGPKSYVEASRLANAQALVREMSNVGLEGYYSIVITSSDSGIETLADAEGADFAFVTPNSTSGFLVPFLGIEEATGQVAEDYFGEVRYTGSHGTSIRAVIAGDVPVAATNTLDLEAMRRNGLDISSVVELWRSDLIPGSVIAARNELPEDFKEAVRAAVVDFSSNAEALEAMARTGFVPAKDEDYNIIRVLEQRRAEIESRD